MNGNLHHCILVPQRLKLRTTPRGAADCNEKHSLIDINFKVERALYFEAPDALLVVAGSALSKHCGTFDAHRTSGAVDRSHSAQALWRHRTGRFLADGRADRARARGHALCQWRFGDIGAT